MHIIKKVLITLLTIFASTLISEYFTNSGDSLLFPEATALRDFEFTDLLFNERPKPNKDTNIVLVNIGNLDRRGLANEIEQIVRQNPKALGIDCNFRILKEPVSDSLLSVALSKVRNLVMFSKLTFSSGSKGEMDSLECSHTQFSKYGTPGFANLVFPGEERFLTSRKFIPTGHVNGDTVLSFALELARKANPEKVRSFIRNHTEYSTINFRRNIQEYHFLDVSDFTNPEKKLPVQLKDKIVIMGFMGDSLGTNLYSTIEDKFHTPLNVAPLGKSYPDMFGVVIQANIISMILHEDFIYSPGEWPTFFINFLIVFFHILVLSVAHKHLHNYYDLFALGLLIVQIVVFAMIRYVLFMNFQIQLDLNITIGTLALASILVSILHLPVFQKKIRIPVKAK